MAITGTWRKQNRRRLSIKIARIRPEIARELAPAVAKNALQVSALQKRFVERVSGTLAESLKAYEIPGTQGLRWRVTAGDEDAFYARMVEFGTPRNSASPFFYPAYRSIRRLLKSRMTRATKKAIQKVARIR